MRRVLALPVLVIALLAAAGVAVAGDVNGPRCADASFGPNDVFYSVEGTVTLALQIPTASCPSITYTLVVLDEASDLTPLATDNERGDGSAFNTETGEDIVELQRNVNATDTDVCIYATTSTSGGREFDRVPNTGCVPLTEGGGAGGSGFE